MNILRVMGTPSYNYGSQERFLVKFSEYLNSKGHRLFILYENIPSNKKFIRDAEAFGSKFIPPITERRKTAINQVGPISKFIKHWSYFFDLKKIRYLNKIIKSLKIDIAHCYFSPSIYTLFSSKYNNIPCIRTIGNPLIESSKYLGKNINGLFFIRIYLVFALQFLFLDKIVCLSDSINREFQYLKFNKKKLITINSGVDTKEYSIKTIPHNDTKKKTNIFRIGFTGRLDIQKNLFFLINVFYKFQKLVPKSELLIVGEGTERKMLENLSKKLGCDDKIKFTGRILDIKPVLSSLDVFIMTSFYEGMPGSLLEAMSMEKACIVSNISSFRAGIVNGENGFLCNLDTKEEFVSRLLELYREREKIVSMGTKARQTVMQKYNVKDRITSEYYIYNNLLKNKV